MNIEQVLTDHKKWLNDKSEGKRANLSEAGLRGADLRGSNLSRAYLRGADLRGAGLRGTYLRGADLSGADLRGTYLSGADLRGTYLRGADLSGADLRGTYLSEADLRGTYLSGADLRGTYLSGADLRGADLRGAKNIVSFSLEKDFGFYVLDSKYLKIGCIGMGICEWLEKYNDIGNDNLYNEKEIKLYGSMIKWIDDNYNQGE